MNTLMPVDEEPASSDKETAWDDTFGHGLFGAAMLVKMRAQYGNPAKPEDELPVGRRAAAQRRSAADLSGALVFVAVLLVIGFAAFMWFMVAMGG